MIDNVSNGEGAQSLGLVRFTQMVVCRFNKLPVLNITLCGQFSDLFADAFDEVVKQIVSPYRHRAKLHSKCMFASISACMQRTCPTESLQTLCLSCSFYLAPQANNAVHNIVEPLALVQSSLRDKKAAA